MAASYPSKATSLEPPKKSVELHDPGARDLDSSDGDEEYYSDASEGRKISSRPTSPFHTVSPIPRTRVEKVDDTPSYGEVPESPAYAKRLQDSVPDEVEVVPEGRISNRNSGHFSEAAVSSGRPPIPRTVVEKVDPSAPSHGDVPGTTAYEQRLADAAPDVVLKAPEPGRIEPPCSFNSDRDNTQSAQQFQIPETVITRVDSNPAHGEIFGPTPHDMYCENASANVLEEQKDAEGLPTLDRLVHRTHARETPSLNASAGSSMGEGEDEDFGDDFDDFEEGAEAGTDEDFGNFDEGAEDAPISRGFEAHSSGSVEDVEFSSFPLIDYTSLSTYPELLAACRPHLDAMFPQTTSETVSSNPEHDTIPSDSPIFASDRSRSLWKQLITPPPLQPPNWTRSHIRRLFLVSLGVPVDLDEILPPSKQKKLILPDIIFDSNTRQQDHDREGGSITRLKTKAANESNVSIDSSQSATKPSRRRVRGPPLPPNLDLGAVRRLCATTKEKIDGFTDAELVAHIKSLETITEKISEVLEYWLKRRDGARKEKEAFEGVIENLVRHVRRVRK